jgi:hypothetical protein
MKTESLPPRLLTIQMFAMQMGCSIWTARAWAYRGRISSVKIGARLMVPPSEIDRLISENLKPALKSIAA